MGWLKNYDFGVMGTLGWFLDDHLVTMGVFTKPWVAPDRPSEWCLVASKAPFWACLHRGVQNLVGL